MNLGCNPFTVKLGVLIILSLVEYFISAYGINLMISYAAVKYNIQGGKEMKLFLSVMLFVLVSAFMPMVSYAESSDSEVFGIVYSENIPMNNVEVYAFTSGEHRDYCPERETRTFTNSEGKYWLAIPDCMLRDNVIYLSVSNPENREVLARKEYVPIDLLNNSEINWYINPIVVKSLFGTVNKTVNNQNIPATVVVRAENYSDNSCFVQTISYGGWYEMELPQCMKNSIVKVSADNDSYTEFEFNSLAPGYTELNFIIGNNWVVSGRTGPEVRVMMLFNGASNNCVNYYATVSNVETGKWEISLPECTKYFSTVTVLAFDISEAFTEIIPVSELIRSNVRNYFE